jgi:hypothetical protein
MGNRVRPAYRNALLKAVRQPSPMLERLDEHWPTLERQILKKRRKLSSEISDDDPIRCPVDLLTPINRILDETTHTRALAYLLNPLEEHGFRKKVMAAVLTQLPRRKGAAKFAALLRQKRTRVDVVPEYRYSIDGSRTRSLARNDIRIEIRNNKTAALIVIENKIDASIGKGQLEWYEDDARKWCKRNRGLNGRSLLVYLGRSPRETKAADDQWLDLSYLDLASALRKIWRRGRSASGHAWLGLYISAIAVGILGIDVNRLRDTTIKDIETYLGKARQ